MTVQNQATESSTTSTQEPSISDPNISFSDYETLRRGGKIEGKPAAAPEEKTSEQKEPLESATEETETGDDTLDSPESEDDGEKGGEESKEKTKKKGGFQRRIDKLNARYSAAQDEVNYWKEKALSGSNDSGKETKTEAKQIEGKPNADDFETHAEYVEALTDWKTDQKLNEREKKLEQSKLESAQAESMKKHQERLLAFSEKNSDFLDVLGEVDHVRVSPTVGQILVESENGPEIMYELAKDPAEFERICKLSPVAAAREIGKIESRLEKVSEEKKQEPKKLTKAPKPIEPVGGSKGAVAKSISDPDISFSDYERLRREQKKRR